MIEIFLSLIIISIITAICTYIRFIIASKAWDEITQWLNNTFRKW